MSKFKVGDKVVLRADQDVYSLTDKPFYEVQRIDEDLLYLINDEGSLVGWYDWRFDLVNEEMLSEPSSVTINDLLPLIQQWGRDRGILDNSTPLGQSRKTVEEVRELVEAAAKTEAFLDVVDSYGLGGADTDVKLRAYDRELADAIGDIFVTLVMVAGCAKLDINACVAQAYETIKDRKGYLRPDGVFVKEEQV